MPNSYETVNAMPERGKLPPRRGRFAEAVRDLIAERAPVVRFKITPKDKAPYLRNALHQAAKPTGKAVTVRTADGYVYAELKKES